MPDDAAPEPVLRAPDQPRLDGIPVYIEQRCRQVVTVLNRDASKSPLIDGAAPIEVLGEKGARVPAGEALHELRQIQRRMWADNEMPMVGHHAVSVDANDGVKLLFGAAQDLQKLAVVLWISKEGQLRCGSIEDMTGQAVDAPSAGHGCGRQLQAA